MHKGPRGTEAVESGHVVAYRTTGNAGCYETGDAVGALTTATDPNCHVMTVGTLRAHHPGTAGTQSDTDHIVAYAIQERAVCENPDAGPDGIGVRADDAAYTLEARTTPQAVAYEPPIGFDAYNNDVTGDVSKTVDTGQDYHHVPIAFQPTADCLTAAYGTKWNGNASATNGSLFAQQQSTVRRLTPVECERLQGFPDNFTAIPWRKKGAEDCPDGPRYKALGNSMAVPVMRWIGERIRLVDDFVSVF